ncbi:DoxX family protein [Tengunoibacter tsumagoiensis]|uniref:DoxX family protein n=1 Tax=Tengunoibacter tsumagoiensis TaxID=2014871 RepID=A0A402A5L7_9CHLR|nr:DoxX family protein [Tengunoibacter tsumagoiensis]GCE14433.1 hypothetical protein KTT_42920 [Tengunoibacter tsumagoiensis]
MAIQEIFDEEKLQTLEKLISQTPAKKIFLPHEGLFILRLIQGGLMAGHGSQKLFGWFGGAGLKGTTGWLESIGLKPGDLWAIAAGGSEFGGGVLTALGLFHPLGEIGVISSMVMAANKAHWKLPIWANAGGPELPLMYALVSLALMITGPGKYSLDRALGIKLPPWFVLTAITVASIATAYGIQSRPTIATPSTSLSEQGEI